MKKETKELKLRDLIAFPFTALAYLFILIAIFIGGRYTAGLFVNWSERIVDKLKKYV